ncbi:class I SAM-dependent methyltransferase [Bacillus spongiae]|uniref:Class I SAM-dependent methyltransferase n=1 Tax=Bacillus spongiae TaxID=2683610 RepID=A0ABU8H8Z0_9BACI
MSYGKFAYVYDYLMSDVPYEEWMTFTLARLQEHQITPQKVLDLACGTGEMSCRFAKEGWSVTGVDLSEEMLMVAQEKSTKQKLSLSLYQQNMSELEGLGAYDLITIYCDSLNYITNEESIQSTFQRVYEHLDNEGLFIFDVHTPYKVNSIFMGNTFTERDDLVSFIWDCLPGEWPLSVEHDLTFFALEESGQYERFDEIHVQRTFTSERYQEWLKAVGFEVKDIYYDFYHNEAFDQAERMFFVCQKRRT